MHAEHEAVGLVLVVVFGHGEVNFVLDAAAREREVVLERIVLAAALTRGGLVADAVAECVSLLFGRLLEFDSYRRVEVGQRHLQRVESGCRHAQGIPVARFQQSPVAAGTSHPDCANAAAVRSESDHLHSAPHAYLRKVRALCRHALP